MCHSHLKYHEMGRGYSASTATKYKKVRKLYAERVKELGEMAKHTSRSYFVEYLIQKTGYCSATIRHILDMSQKEIKKREIEI